ncbi:MAG TPA: hypothetical protein VFQ53_07050 [Kofleriaceae bacterium]|nr:hypothetical protein [Kofleriaceae bacterium]
MAFDSRALEIGDDNLVLAIVECLLADGLVQFDRDAFLAAHPPEDDGDGDGHDDADAHLYRYNADIAHALRELVRPEHLPVVRDLVWIGGLHTQHLIWNYWDGEDDTFDITSLVGIERCTSLASLTIRDTHSIADLSPLAGLATLESITIGAGGRVDDVTPLLGLPRLAKLDLSYNRTLNTVAPLSALASLEELSLAHCAVDDFAFALELPRLRKLAIDARVAERNQETLDALRARGVTVRVS